jgi:C-terminal processing protease CtpA/Prc
MKRNRKLLLTMFVVTMLASSFAVAFTSGEQKLNRVEQGQARAMLQQVQQVIEKNYFDPAFRGVDLHARFAEADKKLNDVPNLVTGVGVVMWAVEGLNDSHTIFAPPARNVIVFSGWEMGMVGENCMITAVQSGSDAWDKGLRPGDQVMKVEGYEPRRDTFRIINLRIDQLLPLAEYQFVVSSPGQASRGITTKSKLVTLPQTSNWFLGGDGQRQIRRLYESYQLLTKTRTNEVNDKLMIWKLPQFNLNQTEVEHYFGTARKHDTLILDLRDNGGGGEESLHWMIGNVFNKDVVVGDMVERTGSAPFRVSSRGDHAFSGKLIVLVNSGTGSAAEVFARTIQLEKRGTVIGDTTEGAVRRAKFFPLSLQGVTIITYGVEVSIAKLRMPDGSDLEGIGVTPDVKALPTQADFAEGRDPVLASAAQSAGVQLSPDQAGKLFPVVWATH